jgi:hypothetical protein
MRKVELTENNPISVDNLIQNLAQARSPYPVLSYKAQGGGYRVLSKLTPTPETRFGWISLDKVNNQPSFCGDTLREAVVSAVRQRDVRAFASMKEMIHAMHNELF